MANRRWRQRQRVAMAVIAAAGILVGAHAPVQASPTDGVPGGTASDGPGALSHFDLARKDCLGTAQNTSSKVWFTVANGVLSDVYYPTNDNTNVETLQYVVTDGSTFTDIQTRDMSYTVQALDRRALDCRVIATAKSRKYALITDYLTDPAHNTVVMHTRFQPLAGTLSSYKLYVVYNPTINGNGGGGPANAGGDSGTVDTSTGHTIPIASDPVTTTNAVNRTYAVPIYSALDASTPFLQVTNGFVGAGSDPLAQLDAAHAFTATYANATDGNLVQGAQVDLSHGGDLTLALGFGTTQSAAVEAAEGTLSARFNRLRDAYEDGWRNYDNRLIEPAHHVTGVSEGLSRALVDEYYLSANLLKASEDKTFAGALQAGPTSPWGQAVSAGDPSNTYFGSYREVFARDLYEQWTGLLTDGDLQTARAAVNFLFYQQQQPDGSMPRNSLTNGRIAPDSFNTQLDECSYPIIMAYQMGMIHNADLYQNHIKPAANFVASHGPSFGPERWEEQGGYSPSTIAAEIADANHDPQSAAVWRGVADDWQRSIKGWTVTTNGPLANHPYFIRISKTGDPNAAISYNLGNGGPTLDQRSVIDQGFLELVRLGELSVNDSAVVESLPVVDSTIMSNTVSGPGWHRYNGDGYGDGATDGHPWQPSGKGTGHVWPVLTGERAEYELAAGRWVQALLLLNTMRNFASGVGLIPEQDWELPDLLPSPYGTDPTIASIGFQNGRPAGSSAPLSWADGQYVRLMRDLTAGRILERPADTYIRYVLHQQTATTLTVDSPPDNSVVTTSTVVVSGTSAAGNTIYVAATNTDNNSQTATTSIPANPDGTFSTTIQVGAGATTVNVVAVSPTGATAHVQRSIYYDATAGTPLLDVTDPTGDDNGPGNYRYPTASDFHPGAYDIQRFRVLDDGTNIIFKLQVRDLSPTFGSPLGAQLVDVYVHDPNAAPSDTSTAAAYPSRDYVIDPAAAWSRLIEVQGFGQQYVDAHGTTLGNVTISANAISRFITFSVPKATLGNVGSGWGFTVALTGQDGFSCDGDQARCFTTTPGSYTFGICSSPGDTSPLCTAPATYGGGNRRVPKAMDVLTPAGVNQSDELDYTVHNPVTLKDVVIP